ncbi:hypothetical protein AB5I83_23475, partial [Mesobacillus sp. LC4]
HGKAVRTWGYFRQLSRKSRQSCPNLKLLQTAFMGITEKLSELEATSDSFQGNHDKAVRT